MRALVAAVAVLAFGLSACGTRLGHIDPGAPIHSPGPSPIVSPGHGFDVLVTDNDMSVAVRVGQRIEVALTQHNGMTPWGPITVDQPDVLTPVLTGIEAPPGITMAGYVARAAGSVSITSTATAQCRPNQACPAIAMAFLAYVTIT